MPIQTARIEFYRDTADNYHAVVRTPHGQVDFPIGHQPLEDLGQPMASIFQPNPEPQLKKYSAKKNKRRSIAQEIDVMEELGGRRHAGSGAKDGLKGDGRVRGEYRVEIKNTRTSSYRVTREELDKIRGECTGLEQPLFVIGFMDPETGGSEDRWILVPFELFKKLNNAAHLPGRSPTTR